MIRLWNYIMDWLYAAWTTIFPGAENDKPGDDAT